MHQQNGRANWILLLAPFADNSTFHYWRFEQIKLSETHLANRATISKHTCVLRAYNYFGGKSDSRLAVYLAKASIGIGG